jgi:hypothetical protein
MVRMKDVASPQSEEVLLQVFARLDAVALGLALGVVSGALIFGMTAILLLKGGDPVGPNLRLLGQFLPGYSVTWQGSLIGPAEGFVAGFVTGWAIAFLRNSILATYIYACAFWTRLNRFLDD